MKILTAMSGGADSSAAALLLLRQGHEVEGGIMKLSPYSDGSDIASAQSVCNKLGIKLHVFDMTEPFRKQVMDPFCEWYLSCKTPNPCVFCNRHLKFGAFLQKAEELGFDMIATGHYAKIVCKNGRYAISVAACKAKDQSYFLWDLPQKALSKTVFPLCDMNSKDEVRKLLSDEGVSAASRGDSQDICFVPNGEYADFIRGYKDVSQPEGDFINKDGAVLGRHKGLLNYTIGQRRFLNVAAGKRIFVISKNAENNTVLLGDDEDLYTNEVRAEKVRLQLYESIPEPTLLTAKIRYGKTAYPAYVTAQDGGFAALRFESPQRAPAPGQSVVFYDNDTVAGGGFII